MSGGKYPRGKCPGKMSGGNVRGQMSVGKCPDTNKIMGKCINFADIEGKFILCLEIG